MDKYKVVISQRAFTSVFECVSFVKRLSTESSEKLYLEIMSSINSLSTFPNRNPEIKDLTIRQTPIRRMIICEGRYAIIYKISNNNEVFAYDVLDNRKDNKLLNII